MASLTSASPASQERLAGWWQGVLDFYREPALRYALKFGIAGVLTVFIALWLKLQEPTWALFTVYVLMIAQYVGAIGEKSFFRMIGTTVGGLLGYVVTASFQQQPYIFLPLVGLIVAVSTALFGQARYPYAFLLCGLTVVVVTSNGMGNPDFSWRYMLWRVEEVGLGILVTVLVQCLFWPRFARVEFLDNVRAAFRDLRQCFSASAGIFLGDENVQATARAEDFPARISGLRGLLDFGARESYVFRQRLGAFFELTSCLSRIASAIVTLGDCLGKESPYRSRLSQPIARLHQALEAALEGLGATDFSAPRREAHRVELDAAFRELEESVVALRKDPETFNFTAEDVMQLSLHCIALDDIRQQIIRAHELIDNLDNLPASTRHKMEPYVSPIPPRFWIRTGIKAGIAVVVALLINNWCNPPGGTMFALGAWAFVAMNATSPGGRGDRRAFHYAAYNVLILGVVCLILIAIRPLLSSYAVMNILLFTWLFVWGYLSYSIKGVTIPMQMAMLLSVGILGLNGQQPIEIQAIFGLIIGLVLGQMLAAVIQRVLWPSLPNWEMRDRFVDFLRICRKVVEQGVASLPLWERARLALIPGEATMRIAVLQEGICPDGEQQRLTDYLRLLQRTASHLISTIGQIKDLLPAEYPGSTGQEAQHLERLISEHLLAHEQSMKESVPLAVDTGPLEKALEDWQEWTKEIRIWLIRQEYPIANSLRIIGLAARYEQAGHDLLKATALARQLRLPLYMGDYVL